MGGSAHRRVGAGQAQDVWLQGQHAGRARACSARARPAGNRAAGKLARRLRPVAVQAGVAGIEIELMISAGPSPQRLRMASYTLVRAVLIAHRLQVARMHGHLQ